MWKMTLPKNNQPVLGVDASLAETGLCILYEDNKNAKLLQIKGGKLRGVQRLHFFRLHFIDLLDKYKPKFAMIENYAYAVGNKGHTYNIGELGGVLRLALYDKCIPFDTVAPPSVKKYCVGKGICDKNLILKEVFRKWGLDTTSDDLADAFVIAKIADSIWKIRHNELVTLVKYEREVCDRILKEV